jgi:hypothetical protein
VALSLLPNPGRSVAQMNGSRPLSFQLAGGHVQWDFDDSIVSGDRMVPRVIEIRAPGSAEGEDPSLSMTITVVDDVPRCSHIELSMRGRRGIQAGDLRRVRIDDWIESIVAAASAKIIESSEAGTVVHFGHGADSDARRAVRAMQRGGRRRKMNPQHLARVADIYLSHREDGTPTQAVQLAFGTSYRSAARCVQQAREQGLL